MFPSNFKTNRESIIELFKFLENCDRRQIVELLENRKIDVNYVLEEKGIAPIHYVVGCNPLSFAEYMTKLFLQYGADPNIRSEDGLTPLHIASKWGRMNILYLLIVNGGDPLLKDDENNNSIDYAWKYRQLNTLCFLENLRSFDCVTSDNCNSTKYALTVELFLNDVTENSERTESRRVKTVSFSRSICASDALKLVKNHIQMTVRTCKCDYDADEMCLKFSEICNENQEEEDCHLSPLNFHINSQDSSKMKYNSLLNLVAHLDNRQQNNIHDNNPDKSGKTIDVNGNYIDESSNVTEFKQPVNEEAANFEKMEPVLPVIIEETEMAVPSNTEASALYATCENETDVSKNILQNTTVETFSVVPKGDKSLSFCDQELQYMSDEDIFAEYSPSLVERCGPDSPLTSDISLPSEMLNCDSDTLRADLIKNGCCPGPITPSTKKVYLKKLVKLQKMVTIPPPEKVCSDSSFDISLPSEMLNYDSDTLRTDLIKSGYCPGPITPFTKRVYLKKIVKLQRSVINHPPQKKLCREYSPELTRTLEDPESANCFRTLERDISDEFSNPDFKSHWREGVHKSSFTYILLDPRITNNLTDRFNDEDKPLIWKTFLNSIFYIGKGKCSRPYSHLKAAISAQKSCSKHRSKKIRHIISIWEDGLGIVCVQVSHNIIPVDAYTREAAMIDALGLKNLDNEKRGKYYGRASKLYEKQKRNLGAFLLYRALLVYLIEGEKQLRPCDIN